MSQMPSKKPGTRVCIAVTKEGVTLYGNKEAFASLAEWMNWIASSPKDEHFECHVLMDLEDEASKFEGKVPRNAWVLMGKEVEGCFSHRSDEQRGFELTLMAVEENELVEMAVHQENGLLPDNWNAENEA